MNKTSVMLTMAALGLAFVPMTSAGGIDLLDLIAKAGDSGAEASCGQYSTSAHGWGSNPSAQADMTIVTSSGAYGSGNDAYAWANGFGGGSASAQGGPWFAYCNSAMLGIINLSDETTLSCTAGPDSDESSFAGDVLQASDGALFVANGEVAYPLAGTLDLGRAVAVPLPDGLADTGVDVLYSNGPNGCSVVAA